MHRFLARLLLIALSVAPLAAFVNSTLKIGDQQSQTRGFRPVAVDDNPIVQQQETTDPYYRVDVIGTQLDVAPSFDRQFSLGVS